MGNPEELKARILQEARQFDASQVKRMLYGRRLRGAQERIGFKVKELKRYSA